MGGTKHRGIVPTTQIDDSSRFQKMSALAAFYAATTSQSQLLVVRKAAARQVG